MILAERDPEAALRWRSSDSQALALTARNALLGGRADKADTARALAQAALRRDPLQASAAATLGMVSDLSGATGQAYRQFSYAQFLSRRDVVPQLWFIEQAVAATDVERALVHYDRLLRYSDPLGSQLMPVLVDAAGDMGIARALAKILATRPPWAPAFLRMLIPASQNPETLAVLIGTARLDMADRDDRMLVSQSMIRLAGQGRADLAWAIDRQYSDHGRAGAGVPHNGDFERAAGMPPFDWQVMQEASLSATVTPREGGQVLALVAAEGRSGEVARQLIRLAPGGYRMSVRAGAVSGDMADRPRIMVRCAVPAGSAALDMRLPVAGPEGRLVVADFAIPDAACPAQWLSIIASAPLGAPDDQPWVDDVDIRRKPGGHR